MNETVLNKTMNETVLNKTMNETVLNKTMNETVLNKTMNETVLNKTMNETVLNETTPKEYAIIPVSTKFKTPFKTIASSPNLENKKCMIFDKNQDVVLPILLDGYGDEMRPGL